MKRMPDVTVIGLGNWGSSLAQGCVDSGISLREIVVRRRMGARLDLPLVRFDEARLDAQVLWICVRDAEISSVTGKILTQRGRLDGQIVVHSSGALNAKVLEAARLGGAQVGSVAPVMSFPTRRLVSLKGVMFAVEAGPKIRQPLETLVRKLGGKPFHVESEKKPIYHAAATMASPLLLSEIVAATAAARLAGLPSKQAVRWVSALAQTTLRNFELRGPEKSFSGPFARGDVSTIRLHLQHLNKHPMLKGIYCSLARYAVEQLPAQRRGELKSLLKKAQS